MSEGDDPVAEALARCAAIGIDALRVVFERYGRPLENEDVLLEPTVSLGDGIEVGRLRHRSMVDVIANDHFVLRRPEAVTLAMPGMLFAAAPAALARRIDPHPED